MTKKKKKKIELPHLGAGVELIDTHCHLDMDSYATDLPEVIGRARDCGVATIISIGIDIASSRRAVEIAEANAGIYAVVGVHPHNVDELVDEDIFSQLTELAGHVKVVGYGEIGIDTVKNYTPLPLQRKHFASQVELAKKLALPVIVHDREAHDDIMAILKEYAPYEAGGVMHCFSGDAALAAEVVELGFYLSIPGVVTFNKAEIMQEAVRAIPLQRLLLETDGPFLSPVPRRGKRNEPESILFTAAKVADLKGVSLDELARETTANARRLFGF